MLVRRFGALVLVSTLVSGSTLGCKREDESDPPTSTSESDAEAGPTDDAPLEAIGHGEGTKGGRELPATLTGELHDAQGRIVVLAPGFVAASACTDCGAPSYLWFLAVRCEAEADCEVLTESCAGRITGEGREFTLAFAPNEGTDAKVCADYSGTFIKQ